MLKQRILTALVLLPLMAGMLFWAGNALWATFSGLIALSALWEFSRMCRLTRPAAVLYTAAAAIFLFFLYEYRPAIPLWLHAGILVFWLAVVPLWLNRKWVLRAPLWGLFAGWVLMVPFWLALTALRPGPQAAVGLLAVMALVWTADIAAYFCGRAWGRRKLAPVISPNKSWEGVTGAVLCVAVYAQAVRSLGVFPEGYSAIAVLLLAVMLTAVSIEGDLLESWLKRSAGIKDSGRLLPGHGGVFDRTDSLIAVLPVYAAILALSDHGPLTL